MILSFLRKYHKNKPSLDSNNEIKCVESKVSHFQRFLKIFFLILILLKVESHKSSLFLLECKLSWRVKVLYLLKSNTSALLGHSWNPVPEDFLLSS